MAPSPIVQAIIQGSQRRHLDPNAVLAVARQEGLSGGIGDGGHAYGPFQLNNAGGVITGVRPAVNDPATEAWANSPAGIAFALDRIAKVAAGLHGPKAVNAIVTGFERPANPGREIANANAAYTGTPFQTPTQTGASLTQAASPSPGAPTADFGAEIRQLLGNQTGGLDKTGFYGKLGSLLQRRQAQQQPATLEHPTVRSQPLPGRTTTALPFVGNVKGVKPSLLAAVSQAAKAAGATTIEVTSGARSATHNAQVGGVSHSNHLTGDAIDGYAVLADGTRLPLGQLLVKSAARYGLRSGDVPGFFNGRPDPVHVDDGANVR